MPRSSRAGHIQARLGQNRAPLDRAGPQLVQNRAALDRAGLGQAQEGTTGADNTGQGWAGASKAGQGKAGLTLDDCPQGPTAGAWVGAGPWGRS